MIVDREEFDARADPRLSQPEPRNGVALHGASDLVYQRYVESVDDRRLSSSLGLRTRHEHGLREEDAVLFVPGVGGATMLVLRKIGFEVKVEFTLGAARERFYLEVIRAYEDPHLDVGILSANLHGFLFDFVLDRRTRELSTQISGQREYERLGIITSLLLDQTSTSLDQFFLGCALVSEQSLKPGHVAWSLCVRA